MNPPQALASAVFMQQQFLKHVAASLPLLDRMAADMLGMGGPACTTATLDMEVDLEQQLLSERTYVIKDEEHYRTPGRRRYWLEEVEPNWKPSGPEDPCMSLPEQERWYNVKYMKVRSHIGKERTLSC